MVLVMHDIEATSRQDIKTPPTLKLPSHARVSANQVFLQAVVGAPRAPIRALSRETSQNLLPLSRIALSCRGSASKVLLPVVAGNPSSIMKAAFGDREGAVGGCGGGNGNGMVPDWHHPGPRVPAAGSHHLNPAFSLVILILRASVPSSCNVSTNQEWFSACLAVILFLGS